MHKSRRPLKVCGSGVRHEARMSGTKSQIMGGNLIRGLQNKTDSFIETWVHFHGRAAGIHNFRPQSPGDKPLTEKRIQV